VFRKLLLVVTFSFVAITSLSLIVFSDDQQTIDLFGFSNILPFIDSNRYTHDKTDEIAVSDTFTDGYTTIETDLGTVHLDTKSLAFEFDSNGYIFKSAPDLSGTDFPVSVIYSMASALNVQSYNMNNVNYAVVRENLYTMGSSSTITYITNGFEAKVTMGTSRIKMTLVVTFEEDAIHVSIPFDSIVEPENYKLKSIQIYKDFGTVYEDDVPGYVFIPDGVGALMDYSADDLGMPNYKKSVYDNTLGYNTDEDLNNMVAEDYRIYAPVFGFVHGVDQHAIFANITSGDEYANINVYYPSRNRGYTTIFPEFVFRQTYAQPIDQIGNTITLLQDQMNPVDIALTYTILSDSDANYVGMAKTYRDYLLNEGANPLGTIDAAPLLLSFLAAENTQGVLWTKHIELSTLADILDIVNEINTTLDPALQVSIEGYTRKGVTWSGPVYTKLDRRFGSESELEELSTLVDRLLVVTDHMLAPSSGSGYSQYTDLASKINDQLYQFMDYTSNYYVLEYSVLESRFTGSLAMFDGLNVDHAYRSFGSLLYDDFGNDLYLPDQIALLQELLGSLESDVALYDSNAYLWTEMDQLLDAPLYSSQYVSFDDTVPFIPIALSNLVDLYSPSATFLPYVRDDLLRMVDFHVYPSFIVTTKYTTELQKTNLRDIYVSQYDVISPMIFTYYNFVKDGLNQTLNATIETREILQDGVVLVGYDNGVEIIINYTDQAVNVLGVDVPAKSYEVGDLR